MTLPRSFYARPTVEVAQDLLGNFLVRKTEAGLMSGEIVEVEAYTGTDDPASHAFVGMTKRNGVMFGEAGFSYVYFIYGMYHCFNVVTERAEVPGAVLIRSIIPTDGVNQMVKNRRLNNVKINNVTNGPGKICRAMNITLTDSGIDLTTSSSLFIEDRGKRYTQIQSSPRVGIRKATDKLWRYFLKEHI